MPLRPLLSLGAGAMARVVLAASEHGDLVAVKIAHAEVAKNAALRALFLAEGAAARHPSHPNLVRCLAVVGDPLALILEYVDGPSLDAVAARLPPLPRSCALLVLADVAAGLAALAGEGSWHGDLCPLNVLVSRVGKASLTDYGAAQASRDFVGTAGYAAPERVRGAASTGERSDLFSLGVLAWELLRGERLFAGSDEPQRLLATVERPVPRLDADRPDLAVLAPLVALLLERDPARRGPPIEAAREAFSTSAAGSSRGLLAAHIERLFVKELAERDAARNAVAPPNLDG